MGNGNCAYMCSRRLFESRRAIGCNVLRMRLRTTCRGAATVTSVVGDAVAVEDPDNRPQWVVVRLRLPLGQPSRAHLHRMVRYHGEIARPDWFDDVGQSMALPCGNLRSASRVLRRGLIREVQLS